MQDPAIIKQQPIYNFYSLDRANRGDLKADFPLSLKKRSALCS
jgi:hypothetical protein